MSKPLLGYTQSIRPKETNTLIMLKLRYSLAKGVFLIISYINIGTKHSKWPTVYFVLMLKLTPVIYRIPLLNGHQKSSMLRVNQTNKLDLKLYLSFMAPHRDNATRQCLFYVSVFILVTSISNRHIFATHRIRTRRHRGSLSSRIIWSPRVFQSLFKWSIECFFNVIHSKLTHGRTLWQR